MSNLEDDAVMFAGHKFKPFFKNEQEERDFKANFSKGVADKMKVRDEANREYAIERKRADLIKLLGPNYIKESILELLKSDADFVEKLRFILSK